MVIDTSVLIAHLRSPNKQSTLFYKLPANISYSISTVTLFELYIGAKNPEREKDILLLIRGLNILPFTGETAIKAAEIYRLLIKQNKIIEFRDIFIAATCMVNNQSLITLNTKHFERVQDLKLYPKV